MRTFRLLSTIIFLTLFTHLGFSQKDNFLKEYLERWKNSQKYLIAVSEAMPEGNYGFKPMPQEKSFAEQLMHIALAVDWHAQTLIGGKKQKPETYFSVNNKTKKEIIEVVNTTFNEATQLIENFEPAHYEDTLTYNVFKRTKRQIFLLLSDHVTHHRAQMLVYMRLNNIVPPEYIMYQ